METLSEFSAADFLASYDHLGQTNLAFAYGSGAMPQAGYEKRKAPMLDLIMAVGNPENWHAENMAKHPEDYSLLAKTFRRFFAHTIQKSGAGIYYNPFVPFQGREVKYGILATSTLLDDLENWATLYVAGRLHKPVLPLKVDEGIKPLLINNRRAALHTALLRLPQNFSERDLYEKITGLSYTGDSRQTLGVDTSKTSKIVSKQLPAFQALYQELLQEAETRQILAILNEGRLQQADARPENLCALILKLPKNLRERLELIFFTRGGKDSGHHLLSEPAQMCTAENVSRAVTQGLRQIVKGPSLTQTMKGFLTAGSYKSGRYLCDKFGKALKK